MTVVVVLHFLLMSPQEVLLGQLELRGRQEGREVLGQQEGLVKLVRQDPLAHYHGLKFQIIVTSISNQLNKVVLSPSAGTAIPLALHTSPKPRR